MPELNASEYALEKAFTLGSCEHVSELTTKNRCERFDFESSATEHEKFINSFDTRLVL